MSSPLPLPPVRVTGARRTPVRLVVAFPHARLRGAVTAAICAAGHATVVAACRELDEVLATARSLRAEAVVLGTGLFGDDIVGHLRRFVAAADDVPILVVGGETSVAYGAALRRAGAAEYVALEHGSEPLLRAIERIAVR